jgi:hypothetical protein
VGPPPFYSLGIVDHLKAREIFQVFFSKKRLRIGSYFTERRRGSGVEVKEDVVVTGNNNLEFHEANNSSSIF